jgi:hypothetical protein
MAGNLAEWCLDPFSPKRLDRRAGDGYSDAPNAWQHALRGGSWGVPLDLCRTFVRERSEPGSRNVTFGCRPARPLRHDGSGANDFPKGPLTSTAGGGTAVVASRAEVTWRGPEWPDHAAGFVGQFDEDDRSRLFARDFTTGALRQLASETLPDEDATWDLSPELVASVACSRVGWRAEATASVARLIPDDCSNVYGVFFQTGDERGGLAAALTRRTVFVYDARGDAYSQGSWQIALNDAAPVTITFEMPPSPEGDERPREAHVVVSQGDHRKARKIAVAHVPASTPVLRFGDGTRGASAEALWHRVALTKWKSGPDAGR